MRCFRSRDLNNVSCDVTTAHVRVNIGEKNDHSLKNCLALTSSRDGNQFDFIDTNAIIISSLDPILHLRLYGFLHTGFQ